MKLLKGDHSVRGGKGLMSHPRKRRIYFSFFCVAIILFAVGLYLLDYYNIPSWMIQQGEVNVKRLLLTLNPVVVSDDEIFKAISTSPFFSPPLKEAIAGGKVEVAWEEYRKFRQAHGISKASGSSEDILGITQYLKQHYPEEMNKILSLANEYGEDRFAPFGTKQVMLCKDFYWKNFPPKKNDVIFIWEINTLQHLTLLAQAYLFTGNQKYINTISRHINSWVAENPIGNSVNWNATMEVSLRLCSLIWVCEILSHDERMVELFPQLIKTIYAHARYVAQNMDKPRKKNNHGIFSAMGLYFFSVHYPEFKQSSEWRSYSEQRILEELELQYTPGGVHKEFAPTYHKALLDAYLQYLVTKRRMKEVVSEDVLKRIKAQLYFLRDFTDPNGKVFSIGDSDDHHFIRMESSDYSDSTPTLHLGSLLFSSPEFSALSPAAEWKAIWLLGYKLYKTLSSSLAKTGITTLNDDHRLKVYWDEGYFRIDTQDIMLFGDFGRLGAEVHFSGHNHCDITSFLLWKGNAPIVIDPGTYTYRQSHVLNGVLWRDYFRSSMAHNTTVVDGKSQSVSTGDFGYQSWPDAKIMFAGSVNDFSIVGGEHNAYQEYIGRAIRVFVVLRDSVLVVDWFPDSVGMHSYDTNLIFGQTNVGVQGKDLVLPQGVLHWLADLNMETQVLTGSYNPIGGWYSPAYGTLIGTPQLHIRKPMEGRAICAFLIDLSDKNYLSFDKYALVLEPLKNDSLVLRADIAKDKMILLLNPAKDRVASPASYNGWTTDAQIAAFELKKGGRALVYNGTYMKAPYWGPQVKILK